MNKIFLTFLISLAIIGMLLINGCQQTTGTGVLNLQVTDAKPELNISEATVTVSNIQVHKALENSNDTNETSEDSWITVINETKTFDLVAIKGQKLSIGQETLDIGKYTQVRLSVIEAKITVNGTEYDMTVPSEKIKLIKGFTIEENQTVTLTLDFDLNESVHEANGSYIFNPVIKIIQE